MLRLTSSASLASSRSITLRASLILSSPDVYHSVHAYQRRYFYEKFRSDHENVSDPIGDFTQEIPRHPNATRHMKPEYDGESADWKEPGATKEGGAQHRRSDKSHLKEDEAEEDSRELDNLLRAGVSREVASISVKLQYGFACIVPVLFVCIYGVLFDFTGDDVTYRPRQKRPHAKKDDWDVEMGSSDALVGQYNMTSSYFGGFRVSEKV